uniref:Fibronectin type-II domain-containing protein n=1 Tax=Callorhinchus milii TaxID=7868 RepID=A0A4W3HUR5_CALMI
LGRLCLRPRSASQELSLRAGQVRSSGNAVGLSPVCNQSSEQQQWKWVSRLRLFNLGSRQCLAMLRQNGSGASAALGTIECDLESAQTRWHCGKLGEQLGGFLNRSPGGAPTSGSWDPATAGNDVWRIYKTNQDLCARPYHEIYTIQGNSNGKPCTIPFKYDNQWYHGCTTIGREDGHLWCATTVDYGRDERWGFCPIMSKSLSPFVGSPRRVAASERDPLGKVTNSVCH